MRVIGNQVQGNVTHHWGDSFSFSKTYELLPFIGQQSLAVRVVECLLTSLSHANRSVSE